MTPRQTGKAGTLPATRQNGTPNRLAKLLFVFAFSTNYFLPTLARVSFCLGLIVEEVDGYSFTSLNKPVTTAFL